jgi:hypothetical protein
MLQMQQRPKKTPRPIARNNQIRVGFFLFARASSISPFGSSSSDEGISIERVVPDMIHDPVLLDDLKGYELIGSPIILL